MTTEIDKGQIAAEELWSMWPRLPVKRYPRKGSMPECATLWAPSINPKITVFELNVFADWTPEEVNAAVVHEYETVDAMLADGWRVD